MLVSFALGIAERIRRSFRNWRSPFAGWGAMTLPALNVNPSSTTGSLVPRLNIAVPGADVTVDSAPRAAVPHVPQLPPRSVSCLLIAIGEALYAPDWTQSRSA